MLALSAADRQKIEKEVLKNTRGRLVAKLTVCLSKCYLSVNLSVYLSFIDNYLSFRFRVFGAQISTNLGTLLTDVSPRRKKEKISGSFIGKYLPIVNRSL